MHGLPNEPIESSEINLPDLAGRGARTRDGRCKENLRKAGAIRPSYFQMDLLTGSECTGRRVGRQAAKRMGETLTEGCGGGRGEGKGASQGTDRSRINATLRQSEMKNADAEEL